MVGTAPLSILSDIKLFLAIDTFRVAPPHSLGTGGSCWSWSSIVFLLLLLVARIADFAVFAIGVGLRRGAWLRDLILIHKKPFIYGVSERWILLPDIQEYPSQNMP